jgi:hypothetical protein
MNVCLHRDADKKAAALEKERKQERDQQSRIHGSILTKHKTHRRPKVSNKINSKLDKL